MERPKIKKLSDIVLTISFAIIIIAPTIVTFTSSTAVISETEKRVLTTLPILKSDISSIANLPNNFEKYLNDHIGLRDEMISWHNQIKYSLFNKSPTDRVVLGKEGWLFITDEDSVKDFRGLDPFTPDELNGWAEFLEAKKKWLERNGIRYLFVITPAKESIYPEYYPSKYNKVSGQTRLDQLMRYVRANSTVDVLDLRGPLLKEKYNNQLFLKTDAHWNANGILVGYKVLIDKLRAWFPGQLRSDNVLMNRDYRMNFIGDLEQMLATRDKMGKGCQVYEPISPCAIKEELGTNIVSDRQMPGREPYMMKCDSGHLEAVVFRDSFFDNMIPIFSEHFNEIIYVYYPYNHDTMMKTLKIIKPDVVIEEVAERLLKHYTPREQEIASINKDCND